MAKKLLGTAELKVKVPTDLWFVHPAPPTQPAQDTVIEGTVVLSLPSARKVKKLDVELIGRQNMFILRKYEQYDTLRKKVTLDIFDELSAGDHEFAWSFIVPANTAPYERSDYGRTYHKVKATAYGCGRLGADLVADSPEIGIVNNANELGQAAQGFSADTETAHEVLGALKVNLFARYFLISGYLRLALSIPGAAQRVRIDNMSVVLRQDVKLQHMKHPERVEQTRPKRVLLWSMSEPERGTILEREQEFSIVRQMRLADDDTIRPSTNPLSDTGIRVSHTLQTVIRFTPLENNDRQETKEMKIGHACSISSCDCLISNLQLPSYSKEDPALQSEQKQLGHASLCLCSVAAREGKEEMERLYGNDPESLGAAVHFGSSTRGRDEAWKPDDAYGEDLEAALRARSRSRSPYPGRSPAASPFAGRSPSSSRPPSRPPSRNGTDSPSAGPPTIISTASINSSFSRSQSRGREPPTSQFAYINFRSA